MADNFAAGFAHFMTESPVLFGVNFQELGGFGGGLPTIGGSNFLGDALGTLGNVGSQADNFLPQSIKNFVGLPLSLLVIDSYMSETHTATNNITNDPVEIGPNITSHAYSNPIVVTLNFVVNDNFFSELSVGGKNLANAPFVGAINRVSLAFLVLDSIRRSCVPLFLTTRTYIYSSMLIQSITVSRDVHYYTRGLFSVEMKQLFEANQGCNRSIFDKTNTNQHGVGSIQRTGTPRGEPNTADSANSSPKPPTRALNN